MKLLMLGDAGVGKSSLLLRYCDDEFTTDYMITIGIDYKRKWITTRGSGEKVKLQIWDTAGQERFRTLTKQYYRNAMGIMLVYDENEPESFEHVCSWMRQIREHSPHDTVTIIVANKTDLSRKTDGPNCLAKKGLELARQWNCPFFQTSAKLDLNVAEAFEGLAEEVVRTRTHKLAPNKPLPREVEREKARAQKKLEESENTNIVKSVPTPASSRGASSTGRKGRSSTSSVASSAASGTGAESGSSSRRGSRRIRLGEGDGENIRKKKCCGD